MVTKNGMVYLIKSCIQDREPNTVLLICWTNGQPKQSKNKILSETKIEEAFLDKQGYKTTKWFVKT